MTTAETSTLSPHRQRKRDRMVERILAAARQIMREEGVAALSMQELARRMDLRAPSLYNYFSGKTALYDALFELGFTLFSQRLAQVATGSQPWQDELRAYLETYMAFALENPELYQLCFERPVPGFVPSEQSLALSLSVLEQSYHRASALLPQLDTGLTAQQLTDLIIAISHGLTALHLANQPDLPVGQGRFGALIPQAMAVLEKAWKK
jgi:AcrR family transcriptional regulator